MNSFILFLLFYFQSLKNTYKRTNIYMYILFMYIIANYKALLAWYENEVTF